jgi:chromosome partitioning protein
MMLAFANTKGGVGKSTLAVHLAVWLFDRGYSVALLDIDEQRSSSEWIRETEQGITTRTADNVDDVLSLAQELRESHDLVVADAPGGLEELSRTVLILADLAAFPISPSILDLRSVAKAAKILKYAQAINKGPPEARIVLNKMHKRDRISRELIETAPSLGISVAQSPIRNLQVYREAAQQGTVVTRMGTIGEEAAHDLTQLFIELLTDKLRFVGRDSMADLIGEGTAHDRTSLAK